ncbi:MAG TPA: glycosyltransferase family 87 protein [Rhizomicrobium sp.]|jgi:hypothetical protein
MATAQYASAQTGHRWRPNLLFAAIAVGVLAGYLAGLFLMFDRHFWILGPNGKPVPCDFLAYWATGRMTLSGHAALAYDTNAQHAAQVLVAGSFSGYFFWNYPPLFFFVAAAIASVPYLAAFLAWVISTAAAFAVAIGAIARRWEAVLGACASPAILITAFSGQNGFLTAALLGAFLLCLPGRPILGGILLGLMTYKPQFGLLIPLALICGGHWRALIWGVVATSFTIVGSLLAFGPAAYVAFIHYLPIASHASLTLGGEGWNKMQSIYAIARVLGAGDRIAWVAQILTVLSCACAVIWLWRRSAAYELKAAGLVAATMLSTPYLHVYDFPVLLVALAFLYRHRAFDRVEWFGAIAVNMLMLEFVAQIAPIGPGIVLLVGALVLRRMEWNPVSFARLPFGRLALR